MKEESKRKCVRAQTFELKKKIFYCWSLYVSFTGEGNGRIKKGDKKGKKEKKFTGNNGEGKKQLCGLLIIICTIDGSEITHRECVNASTLKRVAGATILY